MNFAYPWGVFVWRNHCPHPAPPLQPGPLKPRAPKVQGRHVTESTRQKLSAALCIYNAPKSFVHLPRCAVAGAVSLRSCTRSRQLLGSRDAAFEAPLFAAETTLLAKACIPRTDPRRGEVLPSLPDALPEPRSPPLPHDRRQHLSRSALPRMLPSPRHSNAWLLTPAPLLTHITPRPPLAGLTAAPLLPAAAAAALPPATSKWKATRRRRFCGAWGRGPRRARC